MSPTIQPKIRQALLITFAFLSITLLSWTQIQSKDRPTTTDIKSLRIAVIEHTPYHDEVIGGVLSALNNAGAEYDMYRDHFNWGFDKIMVDLQPEAPIPINHLPEALDAGLYDVVVLVTGDQMFWNHHTPLLTSLNNTKTTRIIAIIHETEHYGSQSDLGMISPWAQEGRLTLMTLGEHSRRTVQGRLMRVAWEREEVWWEGVGVEAFVPIFDIPQSARPAESILPARSVSNNAIPSRGAVLGRIEQHSRNYARIFRDLAEALQDDPKAWGYESHPLTPQQAEIANATHRYIPHPNVFTEPFTLHLIGKDDGSVHIPPELRDHEHPIIQIHGGLDYIDFYGLVGEMDLLLTAFSRPVYLEARSSAAIPAAIIARTKILASPALLRAYTYLSPPAYILSPQTLPDIRAISLLRKGVNPWDDVFPDTPVPHLAIPGSMEKRGLQRWGNGLGEYVLGGKSGSWEGYETELKADNVDVWRRVLGRGSQMGGKD